MFGSRSATLLALLACIGCDERATPRPEPAEAGLEPAPRGAMVLWELGQREQAECRVVPCPSGSCRVVCPALEEMLVVDIQEPLRGRISVDVDHVNVLRTNVRAVPNTGLVARVRVRPRKWPASVRVQVDEAAGETTAESSNRFVAARPGDGGPLTFSASKSSPSYE